MCFPLLFFLRQGVTRKPKLHLLLSFLHPSTGSTSPVQTELALEALKFKRWSYIRLPFLHTGPSPDGSTANSLSPLQAPLLSAASFCSSGPLWRGYLPGTSYASICPLNLCSASEACFIHLNPGCPGQGSNSTPQDLFSDRESSFSIILQKRPQNSAISLQG